MADDKATVTSVPSTTSTGGEQWRFIRRILGWQLLFLTIIGCLDYGDDNLVYVAGGVLGKELHLSDFLIGTIPFVESVGYSLTAFFIAVVADRYKRKTLLVFGVLAWAAMTAVSGLAFSFASFALARLLIGGAQPAFDSPAASVVSDLYPAQKRGRALGILNAGDLLGILIGFPLEGALIQVYGWRPVFFGVAGLALIVFVMAALCLREPAHGASDGAPPVPTPKFHVAWREARHELSKEFRNIFGNWWQIMGIVGRILQVSALAGVGFFFVIFLMADYRLDVDTASQLLGAVVLASVIGSVLGGWIDSALYKRYGPARHFVLAGAYLFLMGVSYLVGLLIGTVLAVIIGGALMGLFMGAANPSLAALVGEMQPSGRRAYAYAAQITPTFLISACAPLLIGFLATALGSLRLSTAIFTLIMAVGGLVVVFSSRLLRSYGQAAEVVAPQPQAEA